jgi:hypothetical protein
MSLSEYYRNFIIIILPSNSLLGLKCVVVNKEDVGVDISGARSLRTLVVQGCSI